MPDAIFADSRLAQIYDWMEIDGPFVSFRWTYVFSMSNEIIISDSTLRFRSRSEIEHSLVANGFVIEEVRDAPDRPGLEFVFVARSKREEGQRH